MVELVKKLHKNGTVPKGNLITALYTANFDISTVIGDFLNSTKTTNPLFVLKHSILLNQLKKDSRYSTFKSEIDNRYEELVNTGNEIFSSLDSFVESINRLLR